MVEYWKPEDFVAGRCTSEDLGRPKPPAPPIVPKNSSVKSSFEAAFEAIGGFDALAEWGKTHRTKFYTLATKLFPQEFFLEQHAVHEVIIHHALPPPNYYPGDPRKRPVKAVLTWSTAG